MSESISSSGSLPDFTQNLSMFFTIKSRHFSERHISSIRGILKNLLEMLKSLLSNFLSLQFDKQLI
jgi:hypothetical protein